MSSRCHIRARGLLLARSIAAVSVYAGAASADTEPPDEPVAESAEDAVAWPDWKGATGDWGGLRPRLDDHGLDIFAEYTTGFWSNTRGGFETGTRYEGFARWGFGVDFERLVHWRGASFRMNWNSYHGGQPSQDLVGVFPTQALSGWEATTGVRFFEIALRQTLFEERIRLEVGQLTSDGEFFQSRTANLLLNASFGFLGFERQLTPFYPVAAPGLLLAVRTRDAAWELRTAIYTAGVGEDAGDNIGFDWSFDGGLTVFAEAIARPQLAGRPMEVSFGVVALDKAAAEFATGEAPRGRASLYGVIDWQVIGTDGNRPGLSVFFRTFGTPSSSAVLTDWYVSGGFALPALLPGRPDDAFGFGFTHQAFDQDYVAQLAASGVDVSDRESVIEFTYRTQVFKWLVVQPDLQVIVDPHFSRRTAVAVGLRGVIGF